MYDIISGGIYWGGPVGSLGDNIVRAKDLKSAVEAKRVCGISNLQATVGSG